MSEPSWTASHATSIASVCACTIPCETPLRLLPDPQKLGVTSTGDRPRNSSKRQRGHGVGSTGYAHYAAPNSGTSPAIACRKDPKPSETIKIFAKINLKLTRQT